MIGKLITFEGIDGSGKSTQIKLISEKLNELGIENIIIREPGGTKVSEKIRDILLDNKNLINKFTETLLFLSSRSQLVNEVIIPAINKGVYVLCDRYIDSTVAYQGYGRGIDISKINSLNDMAVNKIYPDLTFIFDIEVKTSLKRLESKHKDRMEQVDEKFILKVREGYLDLAKNHDRCVVVDCNHKNINEINEILVNNFNSKFKEVLI
tara:strand:- start:902 stop:1528 length:627 start_codon:yes stop_codon:yes gene_type:complete